MKKNKLPKIKYFLLRKSIEDNPAPYKAKSEKGNLYKDACYYLRKNGCCFISCIPEGDTEHWDTKRVRITNEKTLLAIIYGKA